MRRRGWPSVARATPSLRPASPGTVSSRLSLPSHLDCRRAVVHIGTGTGYYTAIMSHLAAPLGKVTGIELDTGLATRAKENLSSYTNVRLIEGDGTTVQ